LLAYAAKQGWIVVHATGSKAFTTVLQGRTLSFMRGMLKSIWKAATFKEIPVDGLFTTFSNVAKVGATDPQRIDLVVCDEAHRLWKHRRLNKGRNIGKVYWATTTDMVQEVILSAKVATFFIDDHQAVRVGEIGESAMIRAAALAAGYNVETIDLTLQFRCAGSLSWVRWVDALLGFGGALDLSWRTYNEYELLPFADPEDMRNWVHATAAGGEHNRLIAGYCWKWNDPDGLGNLPNDIEIGSFRAPWIERTKQDLPALENRYYRWATDDANMHQVGSIYSVQGFEFDRVGVIWGNDLVWRDGRWVANLGENKDKAFKRDLASEAAETGRPIADLALEKLRNVYRVLLTRGMRSTGLHIVDPATRAHVLDCMLSTRQVKAAA